MFYFNSPLTILIFPMSSEVQENGYHSDISSLMRTKKAHGNFFFSFEVFQIKNFCKTSDEIAEMQVYI